MHTIYVDSCWKGEGESGLIFYPKGIFSCLPVRLDPVRSSVPNSSQITALCMLLLTVQQSGHLIETGVVGVIWEFYFFSPPFIKKKKKKKWGVETSFSNLIYGWLKHLLSIPNMVVSYYHFPGTLSQCWIKPWYNRKKALYLPASIWQLWPMLIDLLQQLLQKLLICDDKAILRWFKQRFSINSFNNPVLSKLGY